MLPFCIIVTHLGVLSKYCEFWEGRGICHLFLWPWGPGHGNSVSVCSLYWPWTRAAGWHLGGKMWGKEGFSPGQFFPWALETWASFIETEQNLGLIHCSWIFPLCCSEDHWTALWWSCLQLIHSHQAGCRAVREFSGWTCPEYLVVARFTHGDMQLGLTQNPRVITLQGGGRPGWLCFLKNRTPRPPPSLS